MAEQLEIFDNKIVNEYFGKPKEYISVELAKNPRYDKGWVDYSAEVLSKYEDINEEILSRFNSDQITLILQALNEFHDDKVFLSYLIDERLTLTHMQILLTARSRGITDERKYKILANYNMTYTKLNYIAQGFIDGFDLTKIIDVNKFNNDQVYEIFAGIKSNVDYKFYIDETLSAEQMALIRHGLELGLNMDYSDEYILIHR